MYLNLEGIVLKNIKLADGRKLLSIFSKEQGKIIAGTTIEEKRRNKTASALKPFSHSNFGMYKNRESYSVSNGEIIHSFYRIGEDIERYMYGAHALEYTDKILAEGAKNPGLFNLLLSYLRVLEGRQGRFETLFLAYQIKSWKYLGCQPELSACVCCGDKDSLQELSIGQGGCICSKCLKENSLRDNEFLIYGSDFDMIGVIRYIFSNPLENLEGIALRDAMLEKIRRFTKEYIEYHLDIKNLKTEGFLL